MSNVIAFPIVSRRVLNALAALPDDAAPETWPRDELGDIGVMAAALVTDRLDALPADAGHPGVVWKRLPRELQALVETRNPGMARACRADAERQR